MQQEVVAEFYGLPLIGQGQTRPMNGAQYLGAVGTPARQPVWRSRYLAG